MTCIYSWQFKTKKSDLDHSCHDTMQGYEEEFEYIMDANIAAAQGLSRQYMNNRFLALNSLDFASVKFTNLLGHARILEPTFFLRHPYQIKG